MPNWSVNLARRVAGIGTYVKKMDPGEVTVHYANLYTLMYPSTGGGAHDNHPDQYVAGIDLILILDMLDDVRQLEQDWNALLNNRKHWSWSGLEGFKELFVDINPYTNFNGFADPLFYPALIRHIRYTDHAKLQVAGGETPVGSQDTTLYVHDPSKYDLISTTDDYIIIVDDTTAGADFFVNTWTSQIDEPSHLWMRMCMLEGQDPRTRLISYGLISTLEELAADIWIGMELDGADSGSDAKLGIPTKQHYVDIIDARTQDYLAMMYTTTTSSTQGLRHGDCANVLDDGTFPTFAVETGIVFQLPGYENSRQYSATGARLKMYGRPMYYIDGFGDIEIKKSLWKYVHALSLSGSPAKKVEDPDDLVPPPKAEPAKKKQTPPTGDAPSAEGDESEEQG
jgi:hypothetical protein